MAVPVMRHGAPSGLFDETYQAFVFLTEFSALKTLLFSKLKMKILCLIDSQPTA